MEKKSLSWWAMASCFVSLLLSALAACVVFFKGEPFSVDGVSVLIGMMALVVTIYMSIQVVNALTLERRIRKSLQGDIDKSLNNILYHNMYLTFFFQGVNELNKTHGESALFYLFKSMECLAKTDMDQDKMDEIVMKIRLVHERYPVRLSPSEVYEYTRIVMSTKRNDAMELTRMLEDMRRD